VVSQKLSKRKALGYAAQLSSGMATKNHHQKKIVSALLHWFSENARDLPWRRTRDPYAIWVSEIMLQQTQVQTVMPYWERWMKALPEVQSLARARPERIHKLWEGLGYYTRVRNMQRAARQIVTSHSGKFPEKFEDVLALPGVGRYTAGAICSIAFNQPEAVLDGNVMRVLTRLFGIEGDPRGRLVNDRLWALANGLVKEAIKRDLPARRQRSQEGSCSHFNQSLMELGALICVPRQPRCPSCPLASKCVAFRTERVEQFPQLPTRLVMTQRRFAAFVAERDERFLVRQRPADVVNAHLWEFPNAEMKHTDLNVIGAARTVLGMKPSALAKVSRIQHSITRYRITLEVYRAEGDWNASRIAGLWLKKKELERLAFSSAHKKIIKLLPVDFSVAMRDEQLPHEIKR
jgi:A/G-specific adenine glycosylase